MLVVVKNQPRRVFQIKFYDNFLCSEEIKIMNEALHTGMVSTPYM